jgi:D-xylose transport system ATP-binding protein
MDEVDRAGPQVISGVTAPDTLLVLSGISKHFGGVRAVNDVDLTLHRGEVVALIGDNGAGKSTLVKIMSGVESPDTGEIRIGGVPVQLDTPHAASAAGIRTVFQDLALCDNLDSVQNVFLGQELYGPLWFGRRVRRHAMQDQAVRVLESLAVKIRSLSAPVSALSGGQRQGIAICRALISDPEVVILDEPTAALGVSQRSEVLELIGRLRDHGRGVIVISHDMKDVQQIADRIVVLRLGAKVAEFARGDYTPSELVGAMTGAHETTAAEPGQER